MFLDGGRNPEGAAEAAGIVVTHLEIVGEVEDEVVVLFQRFVAWGDPE